MENSADSQGCKTKARACAVDSDGKTLEFVDSTFDMMLTLQAGNHKKHGYTASGSTDNATASAMALAHDVNHRKKETPSREGSLRSPLDALPSFSSSAATSAVGSPLPAVKCPLPHSSSESMSAISAPMPLGPPMLRRSSFLEKPQGKPQWHHSPWHQRTGAQAEAERKMVAGGWGESKGGTVTECEGPEGEVAPASRLEINAECTKATQNRSSPHVAEGYASGCNEAERSLAAALEAVAAQFDAAEAKATAGGLDCSVSLHSTHPTTFRKGPRYPQGPSGSACRNGVVAAPVIPKLDPAVGPTRFAPGSCSVSWNERTNRVSAADATAGDSCQSISSGLRDGLGKHLGPAEMHTTHKLRKDRLPAGIAPRQPGVAGPNYRTQHQPAPSAAVWQSGAPRLHTHHPGFSTEPLDSLTGSVAGESGHDAMTPKNLSKCDEGEEKLDPLPASNGEMHSQLNALKSCHVAAKGGPHSPAMSPRSDGKHSNNNSGRSSRGWEQHPSHSFPPERAKVSVHEKVCKWVASLPGSRVPSLIVATSCRDAAKGKIQNLSMIESKPAPKPDAKPDACSLPTLKAQMNPEAIGTPQPNLENKHTPQVQRRQERRTRHRKSLDLAISTKAAKEPVTLPLELLWCKSQKERQARSGLPSLLSWDSADSELLHSIGVSSAKAPVANSQSGGRQGVKA